MKCNFCGADIPDGSKFCQICGAQVSATDSNQSQKYENPNGNYSADQTGTDDMGYSYGQSNYNYGQQNGGQSDYNYGQQNGGQPNNYGYGQPEKQISGTPYLIFSILATILCCIPFGIVAIVQASKINSLQRNGDYEGARRAAKSARIWMIVSAVVGLIAAIAMFALGGVSNITADIIGGGDQVVVDSYEDSDDIDEDQDVEDGKDTAEPAVQSGELGKDWTSYTVQINDTVITMPCTVDDFEKCGLKLNTDDTPEDYVINADDSELVYFSDTSENNFMMTVSNNTDGALTVRECLITGIYVADYDMEDGTTTVIFPGGIRIGSSYNEAVSANGEADSINNSDEGSSYMWYGDGDYNYSYFAINTDKDNKITTIDLDIDE